MFSFQLLTNLHQVILVHVLDFHQTFDDLENCVVHEAIGQCGEILVGDSHLI